MTPNNDLLALATVLEIPRPGHDLPLQLRRSPGHSNRWAICDREGRRWHRGQGWLYEAQCVREQDRVLERFTLDEAVALARMIAAGYPNPGGEAPQGSPERTIAAGTTTLGEFRELTAAVPNDWPLHLAVLVDSDDPEDREGIWRTRPVDASVDLTGQEITLRDPGDLQ